MEFLNFKVIKGPLDKLSKISCVIEPIGSFGGLYIGNLFDAKSLKTLMDFHIKAVVSVMRNPDLKYPNTLIPHHTVVPLDD